MKPLFSPGFGQSYVIETDGAEGYRARFEDGEYLIKDPDVWGQYRKGPLGDPVIFGGAWAVRAMLNRDREAVAELEWKELP